jgi:hypothetical protein
LKKDAIFEVFLLHLSSRHAAPREIDATRSRAPNEPQGIRTGPVTAIGFALINVEIRTELEKRVLYALQGEPL